MLAGGSSSSFSGCRFVENTAKRGSALALRPNALVFRIDSCLFSGNWQQSEMRDEATGSMIDPNRAYNDRTLEIFVDRYDSPQPPIIHEMCSRILPVPLPLSCRMGIEQFEDSLVFQMTRQPATGTLGGTVETFRSCIQEIFNSSFCGNGVTDIAMLPSKGALVIESPSCELKLDQTFFENNHVHTSGAAMLV